MLKSALKFSKWCSIPAGANSSSPATNGWQLTGADELSLSGDHDVHLIARMRDLQVPADRLVNLDFEAAMLEQPAEAHSLRVVGQRLQRGFWGQALRSHAGARFKPGKPSFSRCA